MSLSQAIASQFRSAASLTDQRYRNGASGIAALDVQIAFQNSVSSEGDTPDREAAYKLRLIAIDTLLGREPGSTQLYFPELDPFGSFSIVALPSRSLVVQQRPDVALAEAQYRAALADLGVTRADLFSSLSLNAALTDRSNPANVLGAETLILDYAAQLTAALFEGGRRRAAVRQAEATIKERASEFAKAAVTSIADVEVALIQEQASVSELAYRTEARGIAEVSDRIAVSRYQRGQLSLLSLLETKRSLEASRLDEIDAALSRSVARIDLYEACGGSRFIPPETQGSR